MASLLEEIIVHLYMWAILEWRRFSSMIDLAVGYFQVLDFVRVFNMIVIFGGELFIILQEVIFGSVQRGYVLELPILIT